MATLAQKKKNPNSLYWKGKADDEWSKQIRTVGKCEICRRTTSLNAHHLINRTRLLFRHDLSNGICLCSRCHCFDNNVSPHLGLYSSDIFRKWLVKNRPGQFQWYEEVKEDKQQPELTYKQRYEELIEGK